MNIISILENPFLYIEYTIAVILFTEFLKKYTGVHPKWVCLIVGVLFAIIGIAVRAIVLHESVLIWKLITSYAVANVFYDYVLKVIYDKFGLKP